MYPLQPRDALSQGKHRVAVFDDGPDPGPTAVVRFRAVSVPAREGFFSKGQGLREEGDPAPTRTAWPKRARALAFGVWAWVYRSVRWYLVDPIASGTSAHSVSTTRLNQFVRKNASEPLDPERNPPMAFW